MSNEQFDKQYEKQYKQEMEQVTPSMDLINRTKAAMKAEMQAKKSQPMASKPITPMPLPKRPKPIRPILRKLVALTTVAAIILLAVFATNPTMPNGNSGNLFMLRAYGAQLQPGGSYEWQEMDITQLGDFAWYYNGETLYIGLGLWFEFEGENIKSVEFSLENGFFATQYIGNRGQVEGVPRKHVALPPDHTTSRLVMYGFDFNKIGDTIVFGDTMPNDILLFWGSYDNMGIVDSTPDISIEIDVIVTFDDGEIHQQQLVMDLYGRLGMGTITCEYTISQWQSDAGFLDALTAEQTEYVLSAPIENFTYVPGAVYEVFETEDYDLNLWVFNFYIGGHSPLGIRTFPFVYEVTGTKRFIMGARDGLGYIVVIKYEDTLVLSARAYSIPLN